MNQIDLGFSKLGTDSISEISKNPSEYQGQNITVQGEISTPITGEGYLTPTYLESKNSKIEVRGCGLYGEDFSYSAVKVKGVMKNYTTCDCSYKGRYGWSTTGDNTMKKKACINDDTGFHQDSRCQEGTENTRYYLSCQKVVEKIEN